MNRVFYLRDPKTTTETSRGNPIGLILYKTSDDNKTISYAYSVCSPHDIFNKKIALGVAENRMKEKPQKIVSGTPFENFQIHAAILQDIKENNLEQRKAGGTGVPKYGRSFIGLMSSRAWFARQEILNAKKQKAPPEANVTTECYVEEKQA